MSKKKQKESVVEAPEEEKPETTIEESDVEEINVSWVLEIGDGPQLFCKGIKFPIITPSAPRNGTFVFQVLPTTGVSSFIHSWILNSAEKKMKLYLLSEDGMPSEMWSMLGKPEAATWDDIEFVQEEPWGCSLQVIARMISVDMVETTS